MSTSVISRCIFAIGAFITTNIYSLIGSSHHQLHVKRTKAAEQDRIRDLPGLHYDPGFEQFSGYLDAAPTRHVFYWYVESQSDPANDPVVLWTNGGPGCSGLLGFGIEHGPFIIGSKGNLHRNEYSWNRIANMLYIEQPAGVGFSYVDNPSDKMTGDAQAASDNYQVILEFLIRFPERRSNPFFIASESYGGHYIPQLTLEILKRNTDSVINFEGFLVGNPFVDPFTNMVARFESYYSHGLLAKPLFDKWKENCKNRDTWQTHKCQKIENDMFKEFGNGINPYALDYPVCVESLKRSKGHQERRLAGPASKPEVDDHIGEESYTTSAQVNALLNQTGNGPTFLPSQDEYMPCSQVYMENYLNKREVRDALHFYEAVEHYKWKPCGGVHYSHTDYDSRTVPLYQTLVDMAVKGEHNLNMLVYSGDDDSICATAGTQKWIWELGVEAESVWKAWHTEGQTSGFCTKFDLGDDTNATFSFVTVHGAGHEVPAYRPMEALDLFSRFLTTNGRS